MLQTQPGVQEQTQVQLDIKNREGVQAGLTAQDHERLADRERAQNLLVAQEKERAQARLEAQQRALAQQHHIRPPQQVKLVHTLVQAMYLSRHMAERLLLIRQAEHMTHTWIGCLAVAGCMSVAEGDTDSVFLVALWLLHVRCQV